MTKFKNYSIQWLGEVSYRHRPQTEMVIEVERDCRRSRYDLNKVSLYSLRRLAQWSQDNPKKFRLHETHNYVEPYEEEWFDGEDPTSASCTYDTYLEWLLLGVLANREVEASRKRKDTP